MRVLAILFFLVGFFTIVQLVRRRQLKEKYAILWLLLCTVTLVLLFFPRLLFRAAEIVGVQVPANLLFAVTLALLAGILVHLSWESSRTEERTRRLAEEVALLRLRCAILEGAIATSQASDDQPDDSGSTASSDAPKSSIERLPTQMHDENGDNPKDDSNR